MSTVSVQSLVDNARIRHWAFTDLQLGDGALLLYINQRLRTHLANYGAAIEGLVGTSMQYALTTIGGVLIALDSGGIPVYATTYQDGFPVQFDGGGVPFIDTSSPPISTDPFGQHGGTPGFPLPADMIRLIDVTLVYSSPTGQLIPCEVVPEAKRLLVMPGRDPVAFVSGNRLVPLFPFVGAVNNSADRWFSVTAIQISYVAAQSLAALTDLLNLPSVLGEAMIADLACFMAYQSKTVATAEKVEFAAEAGRCAGLIANAALEMLHEPESDSVVYRG